MLKKLIRFVLTHKLLLLICVLLGIIPFFWLKPGYIDIGGDSSRLYFYKPWEYIQNMVLNPFLPDTIGVQSGQTYQFPFAFLLLLFHLIFQSPWFVDVLWDALSLVIAFLAIYCITKELLREFYKKEFKNNLDSYLSGIIAGLFYVLLPISSVLGGWDLALIIQTGRFVYPLIFFFLLKFVNTSKNLYLIFALLTSVVFAQNFSWVAMPNMIAFFSIGLLFLILYIFLIKKNYPSAKTIILGLLIFFALQSFHYIPLLGNILSKNSDINNQLVQGSVYADIIKYVEIIGSITVNGHTLLGVSPFSTLSQMNALLLIFPILIVVLLYRNRNVRILLPMFFFLLTYYLITANITHIGLAIYKRLFLIPYFVMFRDFFGRWQDAFLFYYTLMVGIGVYDLIRRQQGKFKLFTFFIVSCILIINSWTFIRGDMVNRILTQDTGIVVKSRFLPDPNLEKLLTYFEKNGQNGRNLYFPIADFDYQIIASKNHDGAYFGPSIISYLTPTTDLSSNFTLRPFATGFFNAIKQNDLNTASNIFPLLGIQTVVYNSDPYTYEVFKTFPYNETKNYFSTTESSLSAIINKLPIQKKEDFGTLYHLYTVESVHTLPLLYIASEVKYIHNSSESINNFDDKSSQDATYVLQNFTSNDQEDIHKVFLSSKNKIIDLTEPTISFKKISQSKYIISVSNAHGPYVLVFSNSFNNNWKLFLGNTFNPIADSHHFMANAYANAWYILPKDTGKNTSYELTLELSSSKYVLVGTVLTGLGVILLILWAIRERFV